MTLKDRLDQLEEREKKLLFILLGVFAVMIVLLVPLLVRMSVSSQAERNDRMRDIIKQIKDERVTLGRRQAEAQRVERRYSRQAPALAGFLAQMADRSGVEIPETQDRSTVPSGKSFKERSTHIRLNRVGMYEFSNFMEKIAQSGYPVSITKLDIRKRDNQPDQYDVEMDVSAFDVEQPKKKPSGQAEIEEEE